MIEIIGKATSAKVFADDIEPYAQAQIQLLCDHPSFSGSKVRVMPDVHPGKVGTIGFTATVGPSLMPNVVGIDIGCGMLMAKLKDKQETNTPPAGFREMVDAADLLFSDLPQHEMTFDAADAVKRRVSKLMLFAALTAQANEAIRKTGLNPAGFIVDEISLDLFITRDLPHVSQGDRDDIEYFNGPFFEDDGDDRWLYRVATTVFEEDDGVGMATDVMRLDRDAESWEMWSEGKWRKNGPPAHIFDKVLPMSRTILIKQGESEDKVWYTLPARTKDRATQRSDPSADPCHGRAAQQCRSFSRGAKGINARSAALSCTKR